MDGRAYGSDARFAGRGSLMIACASSVFAARGTGNQAVRRESPPCASISTVRSRGCLAIRRAVSLVAWQAMSET